jgi:hypothetical protein
MQNLKVKFLKKKMKTIKYNGHQKIEKNYYSIDGINQTYQINNKKIKIVSKTNY